MGARTVTTREFVCNHCDTVEVFDHDADAGRAGWALLSVNGKGFALCPTHYPELKAFLHVDSFGPPLGSVQPQPTTGGGLFPGDPLEIPSVPRGFLGVHYPQERQQ